ncbi:glycosyltransferase family 2 protein [Aquihabitans daechungensis]|uniref:glycosyltransferase family 2 protein n=1 Tax=Aquihabitans daechungensis TaxID=1052257 RepID=UPI003BA07B17
MQTIDLLWWDASPPPWEFGGASRLPSDLPAASAHLEAAAASTSASWLLLWDPARPLPESDVLEALTTGRADAWHAGLAAGLGGLPEEHDYIHPVWPLARDAGADVEAVSWRIDLGTLLVRTEVIRTLGSLDLAFDGRAGAGLELGRRLIDHGGVVFHTPQLVADGRLPAEPLTEHDRFVFLRRTFQPKWVQYASVRRALAHGRPRKVAAAYRSSGVRTAAHPRPAGSAPVVSRPEAALPDRPSISVVMPTLGRYELVAGVLAELAKQTIAPTQVVVVDQNDRKDRDPGVYDAFRDVLPLEVVFQDERGQWISRNEAVRRTTGDLIAFVDDDSSIVPDFLERHLEGLVRYDADLTTGASLAVVGAPVPESYAFFRVADQWDSGNGMCRRTLFERFGLFDEQFDRQRRGDAEFGLRVQLGGGLVVHVPGAIRTHLKAESGGLRTYGSWDGFRSRDRSGPLPLPSMRYYTSRYHTPRQAREDLLIGVSQAIVPYELKRRATPRQWAGFVATELVHIPSTLRRLRRSRLEAARMTAEGPRIDDLEPR